MGLSVLDQSDLGYLGMFGLEVKRLGVDFLKVLGLGFIGLRSVYGLIRCWVFLLRPF